MLKNITMILITFFIAGTICAETWSSQDGQSTVKFASCSEGFVNAGLSNIDNRSFLTNEQYIQGYYQETKMSCQDARKWALSASALSLSFRLSSRVAGCFGLAPVSITLEAAAYGTAALAIYIQTEDCESAKNQQEREVIIENTVMEYLNFSEPQRLYTPVKFEYEGQI